ncbi:MAG: enoyl-CoA hydratase/isomerase family protein [Spirochaetes bacterium]|nr:enoyl-CoA hydratase/isomerase family protein [Spirochaetota bacterium]
MSVHDKNNVDTGDSVLLEYQGNCAVVLLNRPDKRNAFDLNMWTGLESAVEQLRKRLPRVIVLTGAGDRAFSAGFDVNPANPQVSSLMEAVRDHARGPVEKLLQYIRQTVDSLVTLPVPVIAAINGLAYGGGAELAVRCDMRVMDPEAVICFSETRLGLMPDWGGGVALTRLAGKSVAAELILTARKVGAGEAFKLGLVNLVSRPGKVLEDSLSMAEAISENGPRAVRAALEVIRRSTDMPLAEALKHETSIASDLIASGECVHGISAFLSKKKPVFPDID